MKNRQFQQGFTIIELLMYMGIFSILLLALFQIFTSVFDIQAETQATSSVEQDGKYILTRIIYDIQRASAITTPSAIGAQGSSLQLTIGTATYTYALLNGTLVLTSDVDTNAQMNSYDTTISSLSFTKLGNTNGKNVVTVSYVITSNTKRSSGSEVRSYKTTIGIR